jgi:Gram-negative porin
MKKLIGATVVAALLHGPAYGQDLDSFLNDGNFTFSGYGTAGVVHTNTDAAQFVRGFEPSGATTHFGENVDSNLAVQATARFTPWISATVQALYDNDAQTDTISWAYVKVDPVDNLSFKLGKVEIPLYAISDSRHINYANTWIRPPNEVYALGNDDELKGGEVSYTLPIGSTHLTGTGYYGESKALTGATSYVRTPQVKGGELRWETDWVTLRASYTAAVQALSSITHDNYSFAGYGALMDHNNIIAQAEYVQRRSSGYGPIVNTDGYYVLAGYRFGKVAPYASYAKAKNVGGFSPFYLSYPQSTTALGVRWDAFKSADLKFQIERVDPEGGPGISFVNQQPGFGNSKVTVASLTLDFVF